MAKTVSLAYADAIVQHVVLLDNSFHGNVAQHDANGPGIFGIGDSVGSVNSNELYKVSGLLDGSNKQVMKCSLNDIMFLVMLIMVQASTDQRSSRMEDAIAKKKVSDHAAAAVFTLGLAKAKAQFKAEKTSAIVKIVTGYVSIAAAAASMVGAAATGGREIAGLRIDAFTKAGKTVKDSLRTVANVCRAVNMIAKFVSIAAQTAGTFVSFFLKIDIAKERKKASYLGAEEKRIRTFFEFNMQQIKNMQEAYSTSQRNIRSELGAMREIIQKKQEVTLNIARNV
jgi:hypothetical protein